MNEMQRPIRIDATTEAVAAALAAAGYDVSAGEISLIHRDDRFAATLPGDRMAWFPLNEAGDARLAREARVLKLLARYCSFRAPVVTHDAGWQLRQAVPGDSDPF